MNRSRLRAAAAALVVSAVGATLGVGAASAARTAPARAASISIAVKADTQHAKKGSDGKWHDAFLPAHFTVHSGQKVRVTIRNYDSAVHTFTSAGLHLDVRLEPGGAARPSLTTFTFTAPKPGSYTWVCMGKCDPWAMTHFGFMLGRVTVLA